MVGSGGDKKNEAWFGFYRPLKLLLMEMVSSRMTCQMCPTLSRVINQTLKRIDLNYQLIHSLIGNISLQNESQ